VTIFFTTLSSPTPPQTEDTVSSLVSEKRVLPRAQCPSLAFLSSDSKYSLFLIKWHYKL